VDGRRLVGRGLVDDHVHRKVGGDLPVDEGEEPDELGGPMSGGEVGDHPAGGQVQSRVEVGGAVAAVVVGAPLGHPGEERQDGSGAVEGLDLRLLIDAEHDGRVRRVQVDAEGCRAPCR